MTDEVKKVVDPIVAAARVARLVVHLEMAYDVLDEMASNPARYEDSLYRLSRLVTKVLNDLNRALERGEGVDRERLEQARSMLEGWAIREGSLMEHLRSKRDHELEKEVKRFAALAIAPDRRTMRLKRILEGRGP